MKLPKINIFILQCAKTGIALLLFVLLGFNVNAQHKKKKNNEAQGGQIEFEVAASDEYFFNGIKAMLLGNNSEMYNNFIKFTKIQPNYAVGHYHLANYWASEGKFGKAKKEIDIATQLAPDNIWYKEKKAVILAQNGDIRKSAELFGELAKMAKDPRQYLMYQIYQYERVGEINKALKILDTLEIVLDEDDNEAIIYSRYQFYINQRKYDSVIVNLKKLVEIDPYNEGYSITLAELYMKENKDTAAALEIYQNGLKRFPNNKAYHISLIRLYKLAGDSIKMYQHYNDVIESKHLKVEDKISLLYPIIDFENTDTNAFFNSKGFLFTKQLAEQKPEDFLALIFYADILSQFDKTDEALVMYKKAINIDATNIAPYQQIIATYLQKENYDSLIYFADKTTKQFPDEIIPYFYKGIGYLQQKKYNEAINVFNKAVKIENTNNNLRSAIYTSLADAYQELKNYQISDSCYEAALEIDAGNATALNNYAYYLSKRNKDIDRAERMSAKSLKLQPEQSSFLDTYGWIKYKQGEYEIAKSYVAKAIELTEEDDRAVLYEHLGDIEYKLGNTKKALELWNEALSLDGTSELLRKKVKDEKLYEEEE